MTTDTKSIEMLAEIVTREILSVFTEDEKTKTAIQGDYCKVECVDDLCVTTCFNEIGQVINAGAERITSTFGSLPDDLSTAQYIDHTLLKQDATRDQVTQLCVCICLRKSHKRQVVCGTSSRFTCESVFCNWIPFRCKLTGN